MVSTPDLPVPISHIQGRYLLFDINAIAYLRSHHQICGVFIGTLPQNPSQNVFMGLPMEIMPEEAQVLLDEGVGYILDDARAHDAALAKAKTPRRQQKIYLEEYESRASRIAEEKSREKEFEKRRALKKVMRKHGVESMGSSTETVTAASTGAPQLEQSETAESFFDATSDQGATQLTTIPALSQPQTTLTITPTSSSLLLSTPTPEKHSSTRVSNLNEASYTLYKHLNSNSYFQTPGLRFGCQFCVYPGDPLRFHSHFLAVGYEWNEEIDLMDIVGGGRLGTGVKKGWLVGGRERGGEERVRTFSVEWAGM